MTRTSTLRRDNKTGVPGVSFDRSRLRWRAKIKVDGKTISIGRFLSFSEAVAARKAFEASLPPRRPKRPSTRPPRAPERQPTNTPQKVSLADLLAKYQKEPD